MKQLYNIPTINDGKDLMISYHVDRFIGEVIIAEEYLEIKKYIPKNDLTILDLGCNIGCFSFYMYDMAKQIYAIDIMEECVTDLKETINDSNLTKIKAFNLGIGKESGRKRIITNGEAPGRGGHHIQSMGIQGENVINAEVDVMTLNEFLNMEKIEHLDLVKMDIEGGEYDVVSALDFPESCKKIDAFVGEYHGQFGNLFDVFMQNNFKFLEFPQKHFIAHKV